MRYITNTYSKMSDVGKILFFLCLFLLIVIVIKSVFNRTYNREGYTSHDKFLFKSDVPEIYDGFYSSIYDYLVYNNVKDDYEITAIVNKTTPTTRSKILDVGCGTGHHVAKLADTGLNVIGIDISPSMIEKARENYPDYNFRVGDALNGSQFSPNTFTHILCMYFTLYYIPNKSQFFANAYNWLMGGGYLAVHLVDKDHFDPILPAGNPFLIVSPQKYAKQRITSTKVNFDDFSYSSNFNLDSDVATFEEKFKFKNGGTRKNEHKLYFEPIDQILQKAMDAGFTVQGKIDLLKAGYEAQYIYILVKPE